MRMASDHFYYYIAALWYGTAYAIVCPSGSAPAKEWAVLKVGFVTIVNIVVTR